MIKIIDKNNREVAEAEDLNNAIGALQTLVPEEECDLRAVAPDGTVLAVGFFAHEFGTARVVSTQGTRRRLDDRQFAPTRLDERD